jgi:hypothetical protein
MYLVTINETMAQGRWENLILPFVVAIEVKQRRGDIWGPIDDIIDPLFR